MNEHFHELTIAEVRRETDDAVSLRFLMFAMVGAAGLFVHLGTLFIALRFVDLPLTEAQAEVVHQAMLRQTEEMDLIMRRLDALEAKLDEALKGPGR